MQCQHPSGRDKKEKLNGAIQLLKRLSLSKISKLVRQRRRSLHGAGDKEKAIENYRRALTIDQTMESAKQALKKLTGQ